jgi:UDP-3-O-[3-hydroxymyristoyl] N-acetylglucosamine deacetylase
MRSTLSETLSVAGLGVHLGQLATVRLAPAESGSGWRLNGAPVAELPAIGADRCTALATPTGPVLTVEHLFAALLIAGVDDVDLAVTGPEVPILDGSAVAWLAALPALSWQTGERWRWVVDAALNVGAGARTICVRPAPSLLIDVLADHGTARAHGPARAWGCRVALAGARSGAAPARTYGFLSDALALQRAGLAGGASAQNTCILDATGRSHDGSNWRLPDEPARHKALDLLGDLACLGAPLAAWVQARRPGHGLNAQLVAALRPMLRRVPAPS